MQFIAPITADAQPTGSGQTHTFRPRIDYLSIPVLAKIRMPNPVLQPYLLAGPRFDLHLSTYPDYFDPAVEHFVTTEYGATAGLGIELSTLLPFSILVEVRYNATL
jgi:hypothetical protein